MRHVYQSISGTMHLVLLSLLVCLSCRADDQPAPIEGSNGISLVAIGEVDDAFLARVQTRLEAVLTVRVVQRAPSSILKKTPQDEAKALSVLLNPGDRCLLALLNISEGIEFREGAFPEDRVGLVNIRALRPTDLSTDDGKEQYMRRIEKRSLFVVGSILGLEPCPLPLCAMHTVESEKDLDDTARDFCPPCQEKIIELLGKKEVNGSGVPEAADATTQGQ